MATAVVDKNEIVKIGDELIDPQSCKTYVSDIYDYLHNMEMEVKRRPRTDYIEKIQKDVSVNMRGVLVDWLVEVAEEYKLLSDTLYLAISYIDRYLSLNVLNSQRLQLLGVSSMLIASKYEEISPPHTQDFCYITDNTYTKQEVTLNLQLEFLSYSLAELSLLEYACLKFLPSMVAASVMFLSRFMLKPKCHPWSPALEHLSGYKSSDLKECVQILHDLKDPESW